MTSAELLGKQAQERKTLAEKHVQEWTQLQIEFRKDIQASGDTSQVQSGIEEKTVAFTIRAGQETRDLDATHAIEADLLVRTHDIIQGAELTSERQEQEARGMEAKREGRLEKQQHDVRQEYQKFNEEVRKAEQHELYHQNNIASDNAMEPAAENRQQQSSEQAREQREQEKRKIAEKIREAQGKNRDKSRGR